jgi:hypothetical protein
VFFESHSSWRDFPPRELDQRREPGFEAFAQPSFRTTTPKPAIAHAAPIDPIAGATRLTGRWRPTRGAAITNVGKSDGEGTFDKASANDEVAPKAAI